MYNYNDEIKNAKISKAYSMNMDEKVTCRIFMRKPGGNKPLGRPCRL
jgi:hypothetical protein